MKKNTGINPIIAIICILIGIKLGGIIGAVLSIPLYIVIRVSVSEMYRLRQQS